MESFSFCPQCAKSGLTIHESRWVACAFCGFTFYFNVGAAVAGLIRNRANELLLTRRNHPPGAGLLDLPGGFVDFGETAEAAICREIKEELHLDVVDSRYLGTVYGTYAYKGVTYPVLNMAFSCVIDDEKEMVCSDEIATALFVSKHKIDFEQVGIDAVRTILKKYG